MSHQSQTPISNDSRVERVKEYLEIESEAAPEVEETRPPANWPVNGSVEFIDYTTSYRADLPPVLKKISFDIKGGQKVGIVGRTGEWILHISFS